MNPIATAALQRALARRGVRLEKMGEDASADSGHGDQALAGDPPVARERYLPPPDEAMRVDLVLRIEGRCEALGIVERSKLMIRRAGDLAILQDQLERAAHGRPYSYAVGVLDVSSLVHQLIDRPARREDSAAPRITRTVDVARHEDITP
jgi:hypothetical protein